MSGVAETLGGENAGQVPRRRWSEGHEQQIVVDSHEPQIPVPIQSKMFHICS